MRKGGGKAKGSEFERTVCKQLSLWLSNGVQEDALWRSAMSGGRSTVAARKGKRLAAQAGDLSSIHPCSQLFIDRYYVECKAYRDLCFAGLLTNKGHLAKFWAETIRQATHYEKSPMLIAKQNQYPAIVCTTEEGALLHRPVLIVPNISLYAVLLSDFVKDALRPT